MAMEVSGDGTAVVRFETYGGALHTRGGGDVVLFEIAGADHVFSDDALQVIVNKVVDWVKTQAD